MSVHANADSAYNHAFASVRVDLIEIAARIVGDTDRAEDIVQDALRSVLEKCQQPDRVPRAYLRSAVRNTALNEMRRMRRERRVSGQFMLQTIGSSNPDLLGRIDAHRMWRAILREIDRLPDRSRRIARLHWVDGKSCRQISVELGVTLKSVEKRVHYARERLLSLTEYRHDHRHDHPMEQKRTNGWE